MSNCLKFDPWTFFLSFVSIHCAVDGHQMYSGGTAVGKSLTIGPDKTSPTPPLIFTRGGQSAKFGVVFNITGESLNFEPPAFEYGVRHLNSEIKFVCSFGSMHR